MRAEWYEKDVLISLRKMRTGGKSPAGKEARMELSVQYREVVTQHPCGCKVRSLEFAGFTDENGIPVPTEDAIRILSSKGLSVPPISCGAPVAIEYCKKHAPDMRR